MTIDPASVTAARHRLAADDPEGEREAVSPLPSVWELVGQESVTVSPSDALHACEFAKAGFRTYALAGPFDRWRLVLSRVDPTEREPKGLLSVFSPDHPQSFRDLDGYVMARSVGLYGGTNHRQVVDGLAKRLGEDAERWARRLDYLVVRAVREIQATVGGSVTMTGRLERPPAIPQVFRGILPHGRSISLYGPGSSGKTTLAEGAVVSLTAGIEIIPGWIPTRRFTVGLLDWDEGEEEERARLYAICNAYGVELGAFHYRRMSRPLAEAADELGRWVTEHGIEVAIVTPVNRALRASNGDPGGPVFELYEVLREFGTTNVLIDHVTGANVDNPDAAREYGSVAKRDAQRGSFSVYAQSEEPGRRVVVIRNQKPLAMRPRRAPQAVAIIFEPPIPGDDGLYDAIRFEEAVVVDRSGTVAREADQDKLPRLLREYGPMDSTRLCAIGGFDARQVRKIADRARKAGYAVRFDFATGKYDIVLPEER